MVTVMVEAVIGVTMANGDGYNGYAGESDCGSRRGTRGESGDSDGRNGYAARVTVAREMFMTVTVMVMGFMVL